MPGACWRGNRRLTPATCVLRCRRRNGAGTVSVCGRVTGLGLVHCYRRGYPPPPRRIPCDRDWRSFFSAGSAKSLAAASLVAIPTETLKTWSAPMSLSRRSAPSMRLLPHGSFDTVADWAGSHRLAVKNLVACPQDRPNSGSMVAVPRRQRAVARFALRPTATYPTCRKRPSRSDNAF